MPTDPIVGDALLAGAIILAGGASVRASGTGWPDPSSSLAWRDNLKPNHVCSHRF